MEFRDAVKYLRSELAITQTELANALHVNFTTVARWEKGKNLPTRSITAVLMDFARKQSASKECLELLSQAIKASAKNRLEFSKDILYSIEHASLRQLIDDAPFPIYLCDMETYEMLYVNRAVEELIGDEGPFIGRKCYECLMRRDSPCPFCHKDELVEERFRNYQVVRPIDGITYHVQGKRIQWNGRAAQVRYVLGRDVQSDSTEPPHLGVVER